jgi:hypothetical protein
VKFGFEGRGVKSKPMNNVKVVEVVFHVILDLKEEV